MTQMTIQEEKELREKDQENMKEQMEGFMKEFYFEL